MTNDDPIDWQVARRLAGGDDELLQELLDLFPGESTRHLQAIREGLESSDNEQVARGAHSLKSAAGLFGAQALVAAALQLEQLGHAGDLVGVSAGVPALEAETARVTAALSKGG